MGKRLDIDDQRKLEAVLSLLRREEPAASVARRYSMSDNTLYRFRDLFLQSGKAALKAGRKGADSSSPEAANLRKDIEERDQVIGELTIANRLLKRHADGLL
jgi:transposase-like protein